MGRRSPVLGYNHNVRYRGLVFHVQSEDSGIVNPHLFTHLFHGGVIVSTRKLVYDPDADDGVVKSLMQAQHKAVMKELRRGLFDDKIDINLRGTPGLLPRGSDDGAVEDTGVGATATPEPSAADQRALDSIVDPGSSPVIQIVPELSSGAVAMPAYDPTPPPIELTLDEEPSSPEITVERHPHMTPPGVPILIGPDNTIRSAPPQDMRLRPEDSVPPLPPPPHDATPIASRTATPGTGPRRASTPPPMSSASLPPIPQGMRPGASRTATPVPRPQQSITPPVVVTRPITRDTPTSGPRSDVSQAIEALTAGQEDIEIHSPAPGSAAAPPGAAEKERASEYIHRRGERGMRDEVRTGRMPQITDRQVAQPAPRAAVPEQRGTATAPGKRGSGSQPTVNPEAARPSSGVPNAPASRPGSGTLQVPGGGPRRPSDQVAVQTDGRPGSGSRAAVQAPVEDRAVARTATPGATTEPRFGRPGTGAEPPRVHPRAATPPPIPDAARVQRTAAPESGRAAAPERAAPESGRAPAPDRAAERAAAPERAPERAPDRAAADRAAAPERAPDRAERAPEPARAAAPPSTRGTPPENAVPAVTRARTPTAPRPFATASTPRQGASAQAGRARSGSGGVVMSRPAVIVGGRSQTPTPAPPTAHAAPPATPDPRTTTATGARVRRAREDASGRGVFGQDLISEKSLDEVILAYLSEDASEE